MKAEKINGLAPYLEWLVLLIDLFAIGLLLWGAWLALKDFIFFSLGKKMAKEERIFQNNAIKKMLGGYILLSLEILISAGIIESIIKPTLQDIFQLAALVVIRTVISYFLNKEIGSVEIQ